MTVLPRDHPWTVADLDALPEDGLRYELLDGMLLVSPAPSVSHQRCQLALFRLLDPLVPADYEIFLAPVDYQPSTKRSFQPDLLIASRQDTGDKALSLPLLLAVEVLSPSSRSIDLMLKREVYEQAGVAHYWVVDPEARRIITWSLVEGAYGEPLICEEGRPLALSSPFEVTLSTEAIFG